MRIFTRLMILGAFLTSPCLFAETPDNVQIRNYSYSGTGCPGGSLSTNVSPDLQTLSLLFDSFIAEIGPHVSQISSRKSCTVTMNLSYPNGWTFAVAEVKSFGYASLERGVNATQSASFHFQGNIAASAQLKMRLTGPLDRDYQFNERFSADQLVWAPCGVQRAISITTQLVLENSSNKKGRGLLTYGDEQSINRFKLIWRRC